MSSSYRAILERRSDSDLYRISHSKRFLERWMGDAAGRAGVRNGTISIEELAEDCGCKIDISSLRPVFLPEFAGYRKDASPTEWSLTHLWDSYLGDLIGMLGELRMMGRTGGVSVDFDIWRDRQVGRTQLELGPTATGIVHPVISFELSSGCSVGCWFCGISAAKFKGNFSLANGGDEFWKGVLAASKNVLGPAVETAFCYWATEPLDNPEYVEILDIFEEVIGVVPQTTSAIPLRNVELTKRVLEKVNRAKHLPSRFSVLTTPILKRIHKTFSPEELLCVELVLQMNESMSAKSAAGRAYRKEGGKQSGDGKGSETIETTIACISGFLVNMVERRLRLVSPTRPSDQWPDGYITFEDVAFSDATDLEVQMRVMISKHMSVRMYPDQPVMLGSGIEYYDCGHRGGLQAPGLSMEAELIQLVGPQLAKGTQSALEIATRACKDGHDPLTVVGLLDSLFHSGVIEVNAA